VTIAIRLLTHADGPPYDAIMRSVSDFFSYEPGLSDCAHAVPSQSGCVADDCRHVGRFATWEARTEVSAEITWMAVERHRRHGGGVTAIGEALVRDLRSRGYRLALALTSGRPKDLAVADTYQPTRRFWSARGSFR
jgi:hypothetical protein